MIVDQIDFLIVFADIPFATVSFLNSSTSISRRLLVHLTDPLEVVVISFLIIEVVFFDLFLFSLCTILRINLSFINFYYGSQK